MQSDIPFSTLFPNIDSPELRTCISRLRVSGVELDAGNRSMTVSVQSEAFIPAAQLNACEQALIQAYGLRSAQIAPTFPGRELSKLEPSEIIRILADVYSPARGILAGSRWEVDAEAGCVHVHLQANGADELNPHLHHAEAMLTYMFSRNVRMQLHSAHAMDAEALFDRTEALREQMIGQLPRMEPQKPKSAPTEKSRVLFGKAFRGEPTPIGELNLDMGRVIIEGEVIATNHRELKKRNACVISFDVTDYQSTVRVNQFMEADRAKPIVDGIHGPNAKKKTPGMWVRIQGRVNHNKFENDLVIEPYAIMEGRHPERTDKAPHKRVELHLHTVMSSMDALTDTGKAVRTAAAWGHKAIALTDHGGAQRSPAAM